MKQEIMKNVGETLKSAREAVGISINELERRVGKNDLSASAISLIERGRRSPTLLTIVKLANHLPIDTNRIIERVKELLRGEKK